MYKKIAKDPPIKRSYCDIMTYIFF